MNRTIHIITIAIAGILFILLALMIKSGGQPEFDIAVLTYFSENVSSLATTLFRSVTWAGSIYALAPASLLLGYLLFTGKRRDDAILLLSSVGLAAITSRLLKYFVGRERYDAYPALVDTFTNLAFPSVHATQITAFCLALFMVLRSRRWLVGPVLFVIVLGVMCSRLYLQVHYPTDVIAGALLGIMCVFASVLLQGRNKRT